LSAGAVDASRTAGCMSLAEQRNAGLNFAFFLRGIRMPIVTTPSGLQIEEIIVGSGPTAVAGQHVIVHYTGWLADGKKFDSSVDRNAPFRFPLDGRHVIAGWEEGVPGMSVGGIRKLTIPADLAYGARGAGKMIPPHSKLVFEIELLDIA
jgi:FKBP-type peptidyl-prolyl cis-trans isomerase FkpA